MKKGMFLLLIFIIFCGCSTVVTPGLLEDSSSGSPVQAEYYPDITSPDAKPKCPGPVQARRVWKNPPDVELQENIPVKTTIFQLESPASGLFSLQYEEVNSNSEKWPDQYNIFVNIYLNCYVIRDGRGIKATRKPHLMIVRWHYNPSRNIKTAYKWTLRDIDNDNKIDEAEFDMIIEDRNSRIIDWSVYKIDIEKDRIFEKFEKYFNNAEKKLLEHRGLAGLKISDAPLTTVKILPVPGYRQGINGCGPTALAMVLKYYGIDAGDYRKMFKSDAIGHTPLALMAKARRNRLVARQADRGAVKDIVYFIDRHIPIIVMGARIVSSNTMYHRIKYSHWMVVTGYARSRSGEVKLIYYMNPATGKLQYESTADFMSNFWNNCPIPFSSNYFFVAAPLLDDRAGMIREKFPEDRISWHADLILHGVYIFEIIYYWFIFP